MCFIISCFTAGALALYRSVGRSLYYYGVYELRHAKNAFGLCTHKTQLLWVFTTMDLLSVQLSIVLQLEL